MTATLHHPYRTVTKRVAEGLREAERVGFEPTVSLAAHNALAGRPDQPDSGTSPWWRSPYRPARSSAPGVGSVSGSAETSRQRRDTCPWPAGHPARHAPDDGRGGGARGQRRRTTFRRRPRPPRAEPGSLRSARRRSPQRRRAAPGTAGTSDGGLGLANPRRRASAGTRGPCRCRGARCAPVDVAARTNVVHDLAGDHDPFQFQM